MFILLLAILKVIQILLDDTQQRYNTAVMYSVYSQKFIIEWCAYSCHSRAGMAGAALAGALSGKCILISMHGKMIVTN